MAKKVNPVECSKSVTGHDPGGTQDGTCTWCGVQVDRRRPRPALQRDQRTELDVEYRRAYDPDYGSGKNDV